MGQDQAPGTAAEYSKPGKQEGRANSPSVCLFVVEEQPNLTRPGSFTSSSRPSAWFWLQPEQEMGTRPGRAAALPCCRAACTFTQAQWDPPRQEVLTVTPQQGILQPSSTVLTLGQSRAGPMQESPGADSRGYYCSSLELSGMEVVQDKAELGLPHSGASHQLPHRIREVWLKHTPSTQPRHRTARQPELIMWGRHFRLSQPLLHTRHRACVLYWAGLGPQVPYTLSLHSPQPRLSRYARAGPPTSAHRDQKGHAVL